VDFGKRKKGAFSRAQLEPEPFRVSAFRWSYREGYNLAVFEESKKWVSFGEGPWTN
jgi:hypothetical protein